MNRLSYEIICTLDLFKYCYYYFLSKVYLCVYDLNELTEVEISIVMCVYISAYGFKM